MLMEKDAYKKKRDAESSETLAELSQVAFFGSR